MTNTDVESALGEAYTRAWVEVALPGRDVHLPPIASGLRAPLPAPLRPFATIVTAYNPMSAPRPAAENLWRNTALGATLRAAGFVAYPALGRDAERSWVEPSFAVVGAPVAAVRLLARRWGQAAIYVVDDDGLHLRWCAGA